MEDNKFRSDYLKFIIKCVETKEVKVHMPFLFPAKGASFGVKSMMQTKKLAAQNEEDGQESVPYLTRDLLEDNLKVSAKITE